MLKAKDSTLKAKVKDLKFVLEDTSRPRTKAKDSALKAKVKDLKFVLEDTSRTRTTTLPSVYHLSTFMTLTFVHYAKAIGQNQM